MGRINKWPEEIDRQLLELIRRVAQSSSFHEALGLLLEDARAIVSCDGAAVLWRDNGKLSVVKSLGATASLAGLILPANQMGAAQWLLDNGRPVLVENTADDERWQRVPSRVVAGCWLGVPLAEGGRVVGLLEWTAREPAQFGSDDVRILMDLARFVAPVLHCIQLLDDTREHLREAARRQARAEAPSEDLGSLLQPVVEEACSATAARHAFVFKVDEAEGHLVCVAAAGPRQEHLKRTLLQGDGTFDRWGAGEDSLPPRRETGRTDRELLAALGIRNTLIVPLRVRDEWVGMFGVAEPERGRVFGPDCVQVIAHLASEVSIVLERTYQPQPEPQTQDYELVMQSSPLGIAVTNALGEIVAWNPALATVLSHSGRGLVGRRLSEFLVQGDGLRLSQELEEVAITGERRGVDARLGAAGVAPRYVRISLALAKASDDGEASIVAILEDHTSWRILERERVEHLQELRAQHERLQDLDRLRSQFVSNVSHELRTPLAVIKLYADLAQTGHPDKLAHYLRTIEQETQRLETMVENVLDASRLDRQQLVIEPERLAPAEVIAQVLAVYDAAARRKGVELRNYVRDGLPPLWADRNHLIQMLTNLVDNALKYTPRGGRIWVATRLDQAAVPPVLEIAIGDSGIGIPSDELDRIFERFYRGSNNRPTLTGTGLGLAIVRELVERHGGQVTVQSRVGEGSVFTLQFPLQAAGELTAS